MSRVRVLLPCSGCVCRGVAGSGIRFPNMKVVKFLMGEISEKHLDDDEVVIDNEADPQVEYADLAELSPIGDEEVFTAEIHRMVAAKAPRVCFVRRDRQPGRREHCRFEAGPFRTAIPNWCMGFQSSNANDYGMRLSRARPRFFSGP